MQAAEGENRDSGSNANRHTLKPLILFCCLIEEHLKDLQRQRRAKIEEIKRATKYDHLRLLLEKYDDEKKPVTSQKGRGAAGPQTPIKGGKPQQQGQAPGSAVARPPIPGQQPLPSAMRGSQPTGAPSSAGFVQPQSRASAAPAQRTWLDRMADSVLGADPSSTALGPEQKYALICVSCKRHNGLARKEEFEEVRECEVQRGREDCGSKLINSWASVHRIHLPSLRGLQHSPAILDASVFALESFSLSRYKRWREVSVKRLCQQ